MWPHDMEARLARVRSRTADRREELKWIRVMSDCYLRGGRGAPVQDDNPGGSGVSVAD